MLSVNLVCRDNCPARPNSTAGGMRKMTRLRAKKDQKNGGPKTIGSLSMPKDIETVAPPNARKAADPTKEKNKIHTIPKCCTWK